MNKNLRFGGGSFFGDAVPALIGRERNFCFYFLYRNRK